MSTVDLKTPRKFLPLLEPSRYKGLFGGRGGGKCLARGTLVRMFDGGLKAVEDVLVGDFLMGPDSKPRTVLSTTAGFGPLFNVRQKSGEDYVVNDAHILALRRGRAAIEDYGSFSKAGNPQRKNGRYAKYGTDWTLIRADEYFTQSERFKSGVFGVRAAVEYPEADQPIDPYCLGLWLGDGNSEDSVFTNADPEILEYLRKYAEENDLVYRDDFNRTGAAKKISITSRYCHNGLRGKLGTLGVLNNKHIPSNYLIASTQQRLSLLAGLTDSDGYIHNGSIEIVQSRKLLAEQIRDLAWSLGFKANLRERTASCCGKKFVAYRLNIGGDVNRVPCLIERKRNGCLGVRKNKNWHYTRIDVSVSPEGVGEYFGFELDGDHLFLLRDGTVTHNSWFFADLLVERCLTVPGTHAVCIREVQATLEQSVKKLLESRIRHFNLESSFKIQDTKIHTPGGGLIIFIGMQNHTAESIKSLEGYDIAWVEEAQVLSQRSLDLLRPTIRKENSEIWFSWNPNKETDPVDQLLRKSPPSNAVVVHINYYDNPKFPSVLISEVDTDRRRDPDKFRHVWLGEYWNQGSARVFKNWTVEEFESPLGATYRLGADWGYANDPAVLVRMFLDGRRLHVDHEAWMIGCEIDFLPELFDRVPGSRKFFITADSSRPETIAYMQRNGFPRMNRAKKGKGSIEDGIEFMKSYDIIVHPRCVHVIDELGKYSYKTDPLTGEILPFLEDKHNHCIAEGELIACERGFVPIEEVTTDDMVLTRGGYQRVLFADVTDVDRETVIVETTNGRVRCTPDHRIWTTDGFVEAGFLEVGDQVFNGAVVSIGDGGFSEKVYDLTVENHHEFFVGGVLVSNCVDAVRYGLEGVRRAEKYKGLEVIPSVSYSVLDDVVGY